jgi:hypothetical protein
MKEEGAGDANGGEEGVGTAIIVDDDAAPVLQSTEHVFDLVAPLVQAHMVRLLDFVGTYGRDARLYAALLQPLPKPISVVPFVGQLVIGNSPPVDLLVVHQHLLRR